MKKPYHILFFFTLFYLTMQTTTAQSSTKLWFDKPASYFEESLVLGNGKMHASLFEGGINMPFIARWPGKVAAGKVDDVSLISAVDLLPTFCEIAGVGLPKDYQPDGLSQVSVLKGQPAPVRKKPLFWKYPSPWPASDSKPDHWVSYAVVDQTWKLVVNEDLSYVELYDIANDPYEKTDLKIQNQEAVSQLLLKLTTWQQTLPAKPVGDVFSSERE